MRKLLSEPVNLLILAAALAHSLPAQEPPEDLVGRIAKKESETQAARDQYTYRQTVVLEELNDRGARAGEYREVREVIFSPERERTERLTGPATHTLKRLVLTEEDFADIRDIQPFIFREEHRLLYDAKFRGDEKVEGVDCWVLQVKPKQMLQGQRLFDGMLWASKEDYSVVKTEGQAVPQIRSLKSENLFPRFVTIRRSVDGKHWFPALTQADDTLYFRTGPVRIKLAVRYTNYQRFGADSTVTFQEIP
jgi:hypothetical protein